MPTFWKHIISELGGVYSPQSRRANEALRSGVIREYYKYILVEPMWLFACSFAIFWRGGPRTSFKDMDGTLDQISVYDLST